MTDKRPDFKEFLSDAMINLPRGSTPDEQRGMSQAVNKVDASRMEREVKADIERARKLGQRNPDQFHKKAVQTARKNAAEKTDHTNGGGSPDLDSLIDQRDRKQAELATMNQRIHVLQKQLEADGATINRTTASVV